MFRKILLRTPPRILLQPESHFRNEYERRTRRRGRKLPYAVVDKLCDGHDLQPIDGVWIRDIVDELELLTTRDALWKSGDPVGQSLGLSPELSKMRLHSNYVVLSRNGVNKGLSGLTGNTELEGIPGRATVQFTVGDLWKGDWSSYQYTMSRTDSGYELFTKIQWRDRPPMKGVVIGGVPAKDLSSVEYAPIVERTCKYKLEKTR